MAPVPTPGPRILRSDQTGCRHSKRNKSTTIKQNTRKKEQPFDEYDQALDNIRKKKKRSQRSDTAETKIMLSCLICLLKHQTYQQTVAIQMQWMFWFVMIWYQIVLMPVKKKERINQLQII